MKNVLMILLCACLGYVQPQLFAEQTKGNCPELSGRVVMPDQPGYNTARLVSNYYPSKDKFPKVIVYCQNTKDVQNAILWARCHNVPIRVRSGGHNHEAFSVGTGVVVIDVSEMKRLDLDENARIATIQPGITGGELYEKLFEKGLTQVGGTCSDVGISGLVLTGGMGPLLRKHALTCDHVLSFEIVDAKGQILRVTKDSEHKELFWACCGGGGGNFGVVTSIVMKVYPAESVTWFNIGWDWDAPVEQIIAGWQEFFAKDDRKWFSHLDVWAKVFPSKKFNKQPIKIMGVYFGSPEEARRKLTPLLSIGKPKEEIIEFVKWHKAIKEFEDATAVFITDKPEYKSTGAFAKDILPAEANKIIVQTLEQTQAPLLNVLMFSLGGAAQDIPSDATAYFYRDAKFFVCYSSQWLQENDDKNQIGEVDALRNKLLPYAKGDYVGNPDRSLKNYLEAYYGDNVAKLRCVKRKYDPENIFQFEQGIPPADTDCDARAESISANLINF